MVTSGVCVTTPPPATIPKLLFGLPTLEMMIRPFRTTAVVAVKPPGVVMRTE